MDDLTKYIILAIVRILLAAIGSYLLAHKLVPEGFTVEKFVSENTAAAAGSLMVLGAGVWAVIRQYRLKRKVKTALSLEAGSTGRDLEKALDAQKG
jgi:hypothetical protein